MLEPIREANSGLGEMGRIFRYYYSNTGVLKDLNNGEADGNGGASGS